MLTRKQFQEHIEQVLNDPKTPMKKGSGTRVAYWDEKFGSMIIKDLNSKDKATMVYPKNGKQAFDAFK
jgi:hypothetical protein